MRATVTVFDSLRATQGRRFDLSWDQMLARLERPADAPCKEALPLWSPATFSNDSRAEGSAVESVCALSLDFDGVCSICDGEEIFADFYGLIHSSFSHSAAVNRFRVVLPFDRAIGTDVYASVWSAANDMCSGIGVSPDTSCKNPSRVWYLPGRPRGGVFRSVRLEGAVLNPAGFVAEHAWPRVPQVPPMPAVTSSRVGVGQCCDVVRRARAYLTRVPGAVSGSGGHGHTFAQARALVTGFGLDAQTAFELLSEWNATCCPPWDEKSLRRKIAQAETVPSSRPFGYLADTRRSA